jgi:hypothetical protein
MALSLHSSYPSTTYHYHCCIISGWKCLLCAHMLSLPHNSSGSQATNAAPANSERNMTTKIRHEIYSTAGDDVLCARNCQLYLGHFFMVFLTSILITQHFDTSLKGIPFQCIFVSTQILKYAKQSVRPCFVRLTSATNAKYEEIAMGILTARVH